MTTYFVSEGKHRRREDGMCAMEWVAYLAGEPHTDMPDCVDPVLTRFTINLNDALPDKERQRLRPYLTRMIGTRGDGLSEQRSWMAVDWLVRTHLPAWLELAHLKAAARLRSLPPVTAESLTHSMMKVLDAARRDAAAAHNGTWYGAASAVAWAAAWNSAGAAAWDTAWNVSHAAAYGARVAAWDAAVACYGANDGAWDALIKPTLAELRRSLLELLDRMLPTEPTMLPVAADADKVCTLADADAEREVVS